MLFQLLALIAEQETKMVSPFGEQNGDISNELLGKLAKLVNSILLSIAPVKAMLDRMIPKPQDFSAFLRKSFVCEKPRDIVDAMYLSQLIYGLLNPAIDRASCTNFTNLQSLLKDNSLLILQILTDLWQVILTKLPNTSRICQAMLHFSVAWLARSVHSIESIVETDQNLLKLIDLVSRAAERERVSTAASEAPETPSTVLSSLSKQDFICFGEEMSSLSGATAISTLDEFLITLISGRHPPCALVETVRLLPDLLTSTASLSGFVPSLFLQTRSTVVRKFALNCARHVAQVRVENSLFMKQELLNALGAFHCSLSNKEIIDRFFAKTHTAAPKKSTSTHHLHYLVEYIILLLDDFQSSLASLADQMTPFLQASLKCASQDSDPYQFRVFAALLASVKRCSDSNQFLTIEFMQECQRKVNDLLQKEVFFSSQELLQMNNNNNKIAEKVDFYFSEMQLPSPQYIDSVMTIAKSLMLESAKSPQLNQLASQFCSDFSQKVETWLFSSASDDLISQDWNLTTFPEVEQKKTESSSFNFVGLRNAGATCYMNSIIQQLHHVPVVKDLILIANPNQTLQKGVNPSDGKPLDDDQKRVLNLLSELQSVFGHLSHSRLPSFAPKYFLKAFRFWGQEVSPHQQHDALEFFSCLTEQTDDALALSNFPKALEAVLGGVFEDQTIGITCPHRFVQFVHQILIIILESSSNF
ncbi:putative ubiquitin carboxyl-terminal hydrolase FAF-X [Cichlidogyrus casuarinus]|uniref:Ubiquitin carboxyl-terminal hydrolase FAF-X n=1 Tax=Cichlidogyrus casuarinus TaxID=1844966 RepID=A0ABD2QJV1_9PLAT